MELEKEKVKHGITAETKAGSQTKEATARRRFERYAGTQNWPETEWTASLSALLTGKALEVYARLSPVEAESYSVLNAALLKRFDCTEDGFRQTFRSAKLEYAETYPQFGVRIANYLNRWIELSQTESSFEGIKDLLL